MTRFGAQPVAVGDRVRLKAREHPHTVAEIEWYEILRASDIDFDACRIINGGPFGSVRFGVGYDSILDWQPSRSWEHLVLE